MSFDWATFDNKTPLFSLDGTYCRCKVVNVYDGDTCKVVFPLHNKMYRWNVRLTGYDTPEMRPPRSQANREKEIEAACEARNYLRGQVMNEDQLVYIKCGEFDKYGRLLGTLFLQETDLISINDMMIQQGHGYAYDGGTKQKFV